MGYSTQFSGELKFTSELTAKQLAKVKTFLSEDCRDHPEWECTNLTYIDLEFNDDFSGLVWDGAEKTYDLEDKVNLIIKQMQKDFPDFGLEGELLAQGEDISDRWILAIQDGKAVRKEIIVKEEKDAQQEQVEYAINVLKSMVRPIKGYNLSTEEYNTLIFNKIEELEGEL